MLIGACNPMLCPIYVVTSPGPVEVEQTGGQVLLIPFGWGHAVLNLEASIGAMKQLEMVNMTQ